MLLRRVITDVVVVVVSILIRILFKVGRIDLEV